MSLRTLVVGLGQMGRSHALAYHANPGFEVVGLVNRTAVTLPEALRPYPVIDGFEAGLALKPDLVSINSYTDTHADLACGHKRLMEATSPVVDCGVHHLDVMLQITDAAPVQVRGMGVRLSDEIAPTQVNYSHLQVLFADGSVGWYEAGWGPMISETAFFVKDVMGPRGSASIVMDEGVASADVDAHTRTVRIRLHGAALGPDGGFAAPDEVLSMADEPGHQALCDLEQQFVLEAVGQDRDLGRHMDDAVRSLAVVLAADRSMRENRAVDL